MKSSAKVLCLPMGHHFLVEDLPCGTQVLFLHGQPHHFLRPFLQEHWPHFLDLPVVVRIPAGPLGSLKCDPPKGNGRRPQKKTGRTSLTHSAVWRRTWTHWHRSRHLLRFRSLKISSKTFSTVQCRSFTDHSNLS